MNADLDRAVQWYPGHMVRAMRTIGERLKLIDLVIEVADARVARSGRNPLLDALIGERKRLLILNRDDLADPAVTQAWVDTYRRTGVACTAADGRAQPSVRRAAAMVADLASTVRGTVRAIVVGLPNSGKSSIVNGLLRRAAAKTEDRAGVTRQLQWFRMSGNVELMDSPGILVPKIPDAQAQWKLALATAVPRERYDPEEVVDRFCQWARERGDERVPSLEAFAAARGFVRRGGAVDMHNAAQSYVSAFNEGTFGRISLEEP